MWQAEQCPPQRFPPPNPWNLWICYHTRQRGIKISNWINVDNQLILKHGNYSSRYNVSTRVFKSGRGKRKRRSWFCDVKKTQTHYCWPWRWRKAAMNQGIWVASRSWKGQGTKSPALPGHLRLLTPRTFVMMKPMDLWWCYGSHRKWKYTGSASYSVTWLWET